jgi:hypothetical protein
MIVGGDDGATYTQAVLRYSVGSSSYISSFPAQSLRLVTYSPLEVASRMPDRNTVMLFPAPRD